MYAVIEAGGKQYKVTPGEDVKVGKLEGEVGDAVSFDKVIMVSSDEQDPKVGTPYVDGASVKARIKKQDRDKKIIVFKYKPKKRYRVKSGHRQHYTLLEVEDILFPDKKETAEDEIEKTSQE